MIFSIVIQYYNRRDLLLNTILSISKSTLISNSEIIIVDDASDDIHKINDICNVFPNLNITLFEFSKRDKWWSCPVLPANKGLAEATGDIIILQGAEIYHTSDILLDVKNRITPNDYLVYATLALTQNDTQNIQSGIYESKQWYQHSIYRNRCLNFCTAILRDDLLDLGGFDERYAHGIWYGDDDFLLRIKRKQMNIISIDSPYTLHQYHTTMQQNPTTGQLCDKELYEYVLHNETGYKVKNSFLK